MLQSMGKDTTLYPLPEIHILDDNMAGVVRKISEERSIEVDYDHAPLVSSLNCEQRHAYDSILSSIDSANEVVFFVDGPGRIGKTFLYKALLARVHRKGKIAIETATSGVEAFIMPGGKTTHSRFKIPHNIDDGGVCSFTKQSGTSKLLREASFILLDEATMTKRHTVGALDKSMRDTMEKPNLLFGGMTIVFGGDFRQVLLVV